jgi:hypothetical protein
LEETIVVPVYKGDDHLIVCRQMEHVKGSHLKKIVDKKDWLFEGQLGFRLGYSCESQLNRYCQDIADSLDS